MRAIGPHAGKAIGLQLDLYGERVAFALAHVGAGLPDLLLDAEHGLHVVPDLVRDDVGLRKVARRAEAARQLVEEAQVDIDLLVGRAIERADRRLREAAA